VFGELHAKLWAWSVWCGLEPALKRGAWCALLIAGDELIAGNDDALIAGDEWGAVLT
jgi:hypothetical protein